MKYELEPGEQQLTHEEVDLVEDRRTYPATLILTSERAVLTYAHTPRVWLWALFWQLALIRKLIAHTRQRVRHQIRRDQFASVEQGDGGILVFHDAGEGYGHTSFAIKSHTSLAVWQARMQRWAAGSDEIRIEDDDDDDRDDDSEERGPLPSARVVDR